ncbi:MAG: DUF5696 domain-containing protein [Eubacteriales bacterium]
MSKKRKLLLLPLLLALPITVYAKFVPLISSNEYTSYREELGTLEKLHSTEGKDKEIASSDSLKLYLNESDLSIKVQQKDSDYLYSSNDVNTEALNEFWQNYVNSPVVVKYIDKNFQIIQETLGEHGDSGFSVELLDNGFRADLYFGKSGIALSYSVILEGNAVQIRLENEDIIEGSMGDYQEENPPMELYSLSIYPFFGAVSQGQQDGYTILPDGSGALIRYDHYYPNINIPFDKPFYDNDVGIPKSSNHENFNTDYSSNLNFPLYAMVHGIGQSAFLNVVESGSEYGRLLSYPAGVTTDFYFTTVEYIYNNIYQSKLSTSASVTSKLTNRHDFDIQETLMFLEEEEADYVGVGNYYKDYLISQGKMGTYTLENIPLNLSVSSQALKQGLFFNTMEVLSSTEEIVEMEQYFASRGIDHIFFHLNVDKIDLSGKTSDLDQLQSLIEQGYSYEELNEYLQDQGDIAFLSGSSQMLYSDAGNKVEDYVIRAADKNYAQYERSMGNKTYTSSALSLGGLGFYHENLLKKLEKNGFTAYTNDTVASPYTNFTKTTVESKGDYIQTATALDRALSDSGVLIANTVARDYQLETTDISLEAPLDTTIYQFITDTIPFYQIVLSGNIPMFSSSVNEFPDIDKMMLQCIEYHVYPSFSLMYGDYTLLDGSFSSGRERYTVEYEKWKEQIVQIYETVSSTLEPVKNQRITQHCMVAPMVSSTIYENGVEILVNYTEKDFKYQNITVTAMGSEVILP